MFIHIGNDEVVFKKDVIMILDKSALSAKDTCEFLQVSKEEGFLNKDYEMGIKSIEGKKTAVIMDKKVLFSPISSVTLAKRSKFMKEINK